MKLFGISTHTIMKGKKQAGNGHNRVAFRYLLGLGFSAGAARRALFAANDINVAKLAEGVTAPTLYNTMKGKRQNDKAKEILAGALDMEIDELFPEAA
ncbi:hypothetical protein ACFL2O_10795 [Thermodesulfobacteriota bacterium]